MSHEKEMKKDLGNEKFALPILPPPSQLFYRLFNKFCIRPEFVSVLNFHFVIINSSAYALFPQALHESKKKPID